MITVIIPTCNAGGGFSPVFDSFKKQTCPVNVLILDSVSADDTLKTARLFGAGIVEINEFDHGTTRNLGAKLTDGEFVIFMTQDVMPADDNLIAELIRPLQENSSVAVSFARQIPRPDADPIERFTREFNYPPVSMLKTKRDLARLGIKTFFCSNSCAAYRRELFEKLGGFDEGVGTNEDMLFAAKAIMAGYGVYYCAQAKVYHSHNYTLISLWRRYFKIGKFFAAYKWLCEQAPANGQGLQMVREGISYLWKNQKRSVTFKFVLQTLFKAAGYSCGRLHGRIFCKKMRLQKIDPVQI